MSVVALITKLEEIPTVITWAHEFAVARDSNLIIVCWSESSSIIHSELTGKNETETNKMVSESEIFVSSIVDNNSSELHLLPRGKIEVRLISHPDLVTATVGLVRKENAELLVAATQDQTGATGATYETNPLLRQSPCNTVILFGENASKNKTRRVIVGITDNSHDTSAISLAARMSEKCNIKMTVTKTEKDFEEESLEVGRRELRQLLRDAGVTRTKRIKKQVLHTGNIEEIVSVMDKNDLVMIGVGNQDVVQKLVELTSNPIIAIIKRSPPLRPWHIRKHQTQWVARLSPADYADLIQNLRSGSKLNVDFLTMLGLAAAIASLGLLQDSPAVVIGSMLLAPLMTPMLGNGLALAQANPKLGRTSMKSIGAGFVFTLLISFIIGIATPGIELTPQVIVRGDPNLLDLAIAVFSAAAAAYALARPNLVGAVAGVAIATALVPPLCSVGLAISYGNVLVAKGAALLFVTNLVAIILGAAVTFRLLGISASKAEIQQRRWVYRSFIILGIVMIVLAFPLEHALEKDIDEGRPQPRTYPLTKIVERAITAFVEKDPRIEIIATGRLGSIHATKDVIIVLTSPDPLPRSYADKIIALVHKKMDDDTLKIAVYCVQDAWIEENEILIKDVKVQLKEHEE
jgi:uncharacterized hydrophobic protein (TIGR00271 family)